jgi:hypothetical protein
MSFSISTLLKSAYILYTNTYSFVSLSREDDLLLVPHALIDVDGEYLALRDDLLSFALRAAVGLADCYTCRRESVNSIVAIAQRN